MTTNFEMHTAMMCMVKQRILEIESELKECTSAKDINSLKEAKLHNEVLLVTLIGGTMNFEPQSGHLH
jgi:hypothetical protein